LFFRDIPTITLVFSKAEAWPRRCSNGIAGFLPVEELCLYVGR
jgi:hypothetical protein